MKNLLVGLFFFGAIATSTYANSNCVLTDNEGYNVSIQSGETVVLDSGKSLTSYLLKENVLSYYNHDGDEVKIEFDKSVTITMKNSWTKEIMSTLACWK